MEALRWVAATRHLKGEFAQYEFLNPVPPNAVVSRQCGASGKCHLPYTAETARFSPMPNFVTIL